jgi:hypothetical protein
MRVSKWTRDSWNAINGKSEKTPHHHLVHAKPDVAMIISDDSSDGMPIHIIKDELHLG